MSSPFPLDVWAVGKLQAEGTLRRVTAWCELGDAHRYLLQLGPATHGLMKKETGQ